MATTDTSTLTAEGAKLASDGFQQITDLGGKAQEMFVKLIGSLKDTADAMAKNDSATQDQASALGGLSIALVGTREAYSGLGSGIDTIGLNTFTKQITDLEDILRNSPAAAGIKKVYDTAVEAAKAAGAALVQNGKGIAAGEALTAKGIASAAAKQKSDLAAIGGGALDAAKAMAASADDALKLQNAYIQLSASTGNLSAVFAAAGPGLNNLNHLLSVQDAMVNNATKASGLGKDQVAQYYAQLGSIPGALDAIVKVNGQANEGTGMLSATMQLAAGSGRKYSDIMDDVTTAFRDYTTGMQGAVLFSTRIGELTTNLGVQLSDVKSALHKTADEFKMYGNSAEGAADMMNEYVQSLKAAGLSGSAAIEVFGGLTSGIRNMSLAQKSMLSAQTGGAGGLRGAFQIEQMLSDPSGQGIKTVMDKVRQQIMQQTGPIVTRDEAAGSEAAAQRAARQNAILKSGALGSFAKDDAVAEKIMEAFRKGKDIDLKSLQKDPLIDVNKHGIDLQTKQLTELSVIRQLMQEAQGQASVGNLGTMQRGFSGGAGSLTAQGDTAQQSAYRSYLAGTAAQGRQGGVKDIGYSKDFLDQGTTVDKSGQMAIQTIGSFESTFDQLTAAATSALQEGGRIGSGLTGGAGSTAVRARFTSAGPAASAAASTAANTGAPHFTPTPARIDLDVNITGMCIECGQKMTGSSQKHSVSTGNKVPK